MLRVENFFRKDCWQCFISLLRIRALLALPSLDSSPTVCPLAQAGNATGVCTNNSDIHKCFFFTISLHLFQIWQHYWSSVLKLPIEYGSSQLFTVNRHHYRYTFIYICTFSLELHMPSNKHWVLVIIFLNPPPSQKDDVSLHPNTHTLPSHRPLSSSISNPQCPTWWSSLARRSSPLPCAWCSSPASLTSPCRRLSPYLTQPLDKRSRPLRRCYSNQGYLVITSGHGDSITVGTCTVILGP